MTIMENEQLLTAEDVAARLNVKASWVYRAARDGHIPAVKVGRWVRFVPSAVEEWIAQGGKGES